MKDNFQDSLAEIEHERWSDWQAWCHKILRENCPSPELEAVLERWDRQIATTYKDLTESEKQSDRDQVNRYLPLFKDYIEAQQPEEREVSKHSAKNQTEFIEDMQTVGHNQGVQQYKSNLLEGLSDERKN
jgi:hypothetical protein